MSEQIARFGVWEPFETEIVRRIVSDAIAVGGGDDRPLVVDCGANIGWYTIVCGLLGSEIVAFEPMPENALLLRENVRRNGLSGQVHVNEAAAGEFAGRAMLHLSTTNQGDHRLHMGPSKNPAKERRQIEIDVVRLDSVLLGRRPCLLKVDTQGSEVSILRGGSTSWLASWDSSPVSLVVEFWPYGLERCGHSAAAFLETVGTLRDSHRCYEIREGECRLVQHTNESLRKLAGSRGLSSNVRGFVNLLFLPNENVELVAGLISLEHG